MKVGGPRLAGAPQAGKSHRRGGWLRQIDRPVEPWPQRSEFPRSSPRYSMAPREAAARRRRSDRPMLRCTLQKALQSPGSRRRDTRLHNSGGNAVAIVEGRRRRAGTPGSLTPGPDPGVALDDALASTQKQWALRFKLQYRDTGSWQGKPKARRPTRACSSLLCRRSNHRDIWDRAGSILSPQCDKFRFLHSGGKIKIVVASKQGKEAVIALLGPGEFFGEGCLIGQPLRLGTAKAMGDARVMRVEKAEMIGSFAPSRRSAVFTAHLLTRNSRVEEDLVDQLFNSSEKRLARTLLMLANFGKEGSPSRSPRRSARKRWPRSSARPGRASAFHEQVQEARLHRLQWGAGVHSSLLSVVLARLGLQDSRGDFSIDVFILEQSAFTFPC